jgi:hypothetical protein
MLYVALPCLSRIPGNPVLLHFLSYRIKPSMQVPSCEFQAYSHRDMIEISTATIECI